MSMLNEKWLVYKSLLSLASMVENCPKGAIPALSICGWLGSRSPLTPQEYREVIVPLFEKWPKFSGSTYYPVPAGTPDSDPARMYENAQFIRGGFWDRTHPYGANRRELLTFLIHTLLKQIHDEENNQPTFEINL